MGAREFAEGIILQAMADLYRPELRDDCLAFFESEHFAVCGEAAGMDIASQGVLLNLVRRVIAANDQLTLRGSSAECGEESQLPGV